MPETSTLALFAVAAVTLLLIPGPAVLYIVTRSVDQGRAAGLASVCGVHVGTLLHVAAAALGLSALLVSSATAYDTVRWLGAAYLDGRMPSEAEVRAVTGHWGPAAGVAQQLLLHWLSTEAPGRGGPRRPAAATGSRSATRPGRSSRPG